MPLTPSACNLSCKFQPSMRPWEHRDHSAVDGAKHSLPAVGGEQELVARGDEFFPFTSQEPDPGRKLTGGILKKMRDVSFWRKTER